MKLETTAGDLSAAIKAVSGIAKFRNTIPILGTIKIRNRKIVATDLDKQVTVSLAGKMTGGVCIPYRQLSRVCSHIDADESIAVVDSDGLSAMEFNGSKYTFASYSHDDFPIFQAVPSKVARVSIGNAGLAEAMRKIAFAISTEEIRYYLNGISFSTDADGSPVVVATDGHRLAVHPIPFEIEEAGGKIIPREAVQYILSRKVEPETCAFADDRFQFNWPGITMDAKLINGTYPDWKRVVPTGEPQYSIAISPSKWLPVLKRIASLADTGRIGLKAVKITLPGDFDIARLEADYATDGSCVEQVKIEWLKGQKPSGVGFNVHYLIEVMNSFKDCDQIVMTAPDPSEPHTFTSETSDLKVVLMPMRV